MDSDDYSIPIKSNTRPSSSRPTRSSINISRPLSATTKIRPASASISIKSPYDSEKIEKDKNENSNFLPKNQFYLYNKPDIYKLQTDLVEMKKLYNKSESDKNTLKYNILKLENTNKKLEKSIDELLLKSNDISNISNNDNKFLTLKNEKNLIELLKNKITNLEYFNIEKDNEINNIKLSLKSTKMNETNNQINILNNQIKRLEADMKLLIIKHEKELNIPTLNISHWKEIYKKMTDLKEENSYLTKQLEEVVNHAKFSKDKKTDLIDKSSSSLSIDNKSEDSAKLMQELESTKKLLESKSSEIEKLKSDFETQILKLNTSLKSQSDENFVNKEKINGLKKIIKDHEEKNIAAAQNSFKNSYEKENNIQSEYSNKLLAIENENRKKTADLCFDVEKKLTLQFDDKQKSLTDEFNKKLIDKDAYHLKIEEKLQSEIDALNKSFNASNYKVEQLMNQISIVNSEKSDELKKTSDLRRIFDSQVEKLKLLENQIATLEDDNLFFKTESNIVKDENNRLKEEIMTLKSKPVLIPSAPSDPPTKKFSRKEPKT